MSASRQPGGDDTYPTCPEHGATMEIVLAGRSSCDWLCAEVGCTTEAETANELGEARFESGDVREVHE